MGEGWNTDDMDWADGRRIFCWPRMARMNTNFFRPQIRRWRQIFFVLICAIRGVVLILCASVKSVAYIICGNAKGFFCCWRCRSFLACHRLGLNHRAASGS